jgi:hypothetical protein
MGWRSTRYAAFLAVLTLHALLLTTLMMWRGSIRVAPSGRPLEIAFVPVNETRDQVIPPPLQAPRTRSNTKIDEPTITFLPPQTAEAGGFPEVNWASEAHRAADSAAKDAMSPPPKPLDAAPPGSADWFPPSKYHAGDEVGLGNGDTAVFINDHCYQVAPMIPAVVDALHNGMGLHTFCKGGPKDANGDLFKDTEAYKKLHPEK